MSIQTVQIQGQGYLVNGLMSVPNSPSNRHYQRVQEWIAAGNTPEPEFTAPELLANAKRDKIQELKAEGLSRIQAAIPGIAGWDHLGLVREQWLSIASAARSATADFQLVIDVYQAGRAAVSDIGALTAVTAIDGYDVVADPSWPV